MDDVITGLWAAILEEVKLNGMSCAVDGQPLHLESGAESDGEWDLWAQGRLNGLCDSDRYILL